MIGQIIEKTLDGEHCFWQDANGIHDATGNLEIYSPGHLLRDGWRKYYIPAGSLLCAYSYRMAKWSNLAI